MSSHISRRRLIHGGAGLVGLALNRVQTAEAAPGRAPETIVFVHLRGGADGLSLLVPYTSEAYYRARRSTAIAPPGRGSGSALPITDEFGLHPELGPLRSYFLSRELGAVVGVGMPELARSHSSASRAIDQAISHALGGQSPEPLAGSFTTQLSAASERICENRAPRAFGVESLGWDTHAAQGDGRDGRFASAAAELAEGLDRFRVSLGDHLARVLVVVLTEFGRTLRETPLEGTDDGHASVMFLLGGGRPRARVIGRAPSLEAGELSEGRHLQPSHDLREVLTRVARGEEPV